MPSDECLALLAKMESERRDIRSRMKELEDTTKQNTILQLRLLSKIQETSPRVKSFKTAERRARKHILEGERSLYNVMYAEHRNAVQKEHSALFQSLTKNRQCQDDLLATQAPEPSLADVWHSVEGVWWGNYRTQGFGEQSYARASAESRCDTCKKGSPDIEIRVVHKKVDLLDYYVVEARVASKLDAEIVKCRKRSLSLKEMVQNYWKRGVNPRVYLPWLPHDFERKNGLDYFGNELTEERNHVLE